MLIFVSLKKIGDHLQYLNGLNYFTHRCHFMEEKCNRLKTNSKGNWGKLTGENTCCLNSHLWEHVIHLWWIMWFINVIHHIDSSHWSCDSSMNHIPIKCKLPFELMLPKYTAEQTKLLDLRKVENYSKLCLTFS